MKKVWAGLGLVIAVAFATGTGSASLHSGSAYLAGESLPSGSQMLLVMNSDQFQGKWKQFKGDLKKRWGKFTDDDLMQIEGNYDKYQGKIQERYGDRRAEVERWTDDWFKTHRPTP